MILASASTSAMLLFISKMFACGLLGFLILGLVQVILDLRMNPKGWKFGNELYDHKEDSLFSSDNELKMKYQPIRIDTIRNEKMNKHN